VTQCGYQYEYKRTADTPATPDLAQLRTNGHHTGDIGTTR
jgi:hypothetical protein